MSRRFVIVGAGAFGLSAALELRRRGHQVSVFDPGPIPHPLAASTDISKAVRMDYGADAVFTEMMEEAFPHWDQWNRRWPEPPYHEDGFLLMSREPLRPGGFEHDGFELLRGRGHPVERIAAADLARRFPVWNADPYPDGYFNPRAGWTESGRVIARLAEEVRAAGIDLRAGRSFRRLLARGSRIEGIVTDDGEKHRADTVLVAAGAWTPVLLPHLAPVLRVTGQAVLHFRPADPAPFCAPRFSVWGADISHTGYYGFPATADGIVKIANHGPGRPVQPDAPRTVPPGTEEVFRDFLRGTFPALAGAPLAESRLCLYCDTPDGDFWIDNDPDRPGLAVASGDSGHGFKFVPTLGGLIADVLEGRENRFAARFAWRRPDPEAREGARFLGDD